MTARDTDHHGKNKRNDEGSFLSDNTRHKQLLDALNLNAMAPTTSNAIAADSSAGAEHDFNFRPISPSPVASDHELRPLSPSSALDGILNEGDLVGEGIPLQGQILSRVDIPSILSPTHSRSNSASLPPDSSFIADELEPATTFKVVRKLGTGSYAVVYLVREVVEPQSATPSALFDTPSKSTDEGMFDFEYSSSDSTSSSPQLSSMSRKRPPFLTTGREFAIKCLSKANLDEDALRAQLLEATLHQSLPIHPNIVTLYRTLESAGFLLLVLEFVPGQDLFYFLESSRDHVKPVDSSPLSKTPTTPSLLSALHPSALLSYTRLRLIASMFSQMCDAVAACHARGVYHRDIKPENFIVTEAWTPTHDRKVVVKLTDFGLATIDDESADMDCGSAPYMSYECRNNLSPTYVPRHADVWSLGIVLINMIYHHNPWTDTSLLPEYKCPSFEAYVSLDPDLREDFFMRRFVGMSKPVASFLTKRVFCFVHEGEERVSAEEFGTWARCLPELFGRDAISCVGSVGGVGIGRVGRSRRPSLRSAGPSWIGLGRPQREESFRRDREESGPPMPDPDIDDDLDNDEDDKSEPGSRAASTTRRRKRGARNKSKGGATPKDEEFSATMSIAGSERGDPTVDRLEDMAVRSQLLARELSKASSWLLVNSSRPGSTSAVNISTPVSPEPITSPEPETKGKKKGWKGLWRMASSDALSSREPSSPPPPLPALPPHTAPANRARLDPPSDRSRSNGVRSRSSAESASAGSSRKSRDSDSRPPPGIAANVTSVLNGLSPAPPSKEEARGRKPRPLVKDYPPSTWGPDPRIEFVPPRPTKGHPNPYNSSQRAHSPNWRNSVSTTTSGSSAFTRYSNGSARSLDTVASSVSGHSSKSANWRNPNTSNGKRTETSSAMSASPSTPNKNDTPNAPDSPSTPVIPANIKVMDGVPWELTGLPRQAYARWPEGDIFGQPPVREKNNEHPKGRRAPPRLDTINEQQTHAGGSPPHSWRHHHAQSPPSSKHMHMPTSPISQKMDASTSTTDLTAGEFEYDEEGYPRRVQKGQINALAKMLSALRR